jgi:hypothetical protein
MALGNFNLILLNASQAEKRVMKFPKRTLNVGKL